MRFHYDDYRAIPTKNQLDFNHLLIANLNAQVSDFKSNLDDLHFKVNHFSAKDKSGFKLSEFSTQTKISNQSINLENLLIKTTNSEINFSSFNLHYNSFEAFNSFEEKVRFNVKMDSSLLSMQDLSYFVPEINGMTQKISLSGNFNNVLNALEMRKVKLRLGKKTKIEGSFNLPELKNIYTSRFNQNIKYMYLDIEDIQNIDLPNNYSALEVLSNPILQKLSYLEIKETQLDGELVDFNLSMDAINTNMGALSLDAIQIKWDSINSNAFIYANRSNSSVQVSSFNLGEVLSEERLDKFSGDLSFESKIPPDFDFLINDFHAELTSVTIENNLYENVSIYNGSFESNKLACEVRIDDKKLKMKVNDVSLDFNKGDYALKIDLEQALLNSLDLVSNDTLTTFKTDMEVNLYGSIDNLEGELIMLNTYYSKAGMPPINVPKFKCEINRDKKEDELIILSSLFDFQANGKFDFNTISEDLLSLFNSFVPNSSQRKTKSRNKNNFAFQASLKDFKSVLDNFIPDVFVSNGTQIFGGYDSKKDSFNLKLSSDSIKYKELKLVSVLLDQKINNGDVNAKFTVDSFQLGDSIQLKKFAFNTSGKNSHLQSHITWDPSSTYASDIFWETDIVSSDIYSFSIRPSTFSFNKKVWLIKDSSDIMVSGSDVKVDSLIFKRENQSIAVNGCVSDANYDGIKLKLSNIDLSEIDQMFNLNLGMQGNINGNASLSDPRGIVRFSSQIFIDHLSLNGRKVGDVSTLAAWNPIKKCISLDGDLDYLGNKTFDFEGDYFVLKESNNLDFNLMFDKMQIDFANAFLDPDVIDNLSGLINGNIQLKGEAITPKINGELTVKDGKATIALLGVDVHLNGEINVIEDAFFIDNMPVVDEDGNVGNLNASVYHSNYSEWNYNLFVNLDHDPIKNKKTNRFLVMNTKYKDGDYYFGKAYASGFCEIEGDESYIRVSVDLTSQDGTKINFPMYGSSDYTDEDDFITFISKEIKEEITPKVDFSTVDLDLNFNITPKAQIKLTFDEQTGDEITAFGTGNVNMTMNDIHELKLEGAFDIDKGSRYDFAMGQLKQIFDIQPGSKIIWTGDPYDADINIITSFTINSDYGALAPELKAVNEQKSLSNKEVNCFLNLTESLLKPKITFDITSDPSLPETGKALLTRVVSDPSELNRQFFSLLLFNSFQPLQGQISASGSAALNLVESQINALLGQVSKDYKLSFNFESGEFQENSSNNQLVNSEYSVMEFDVSKSFLDNRLIISGSFGVETGVSKISDQESSNSSNDNTSLIGDVMIEYLINESGTFRVNAFNESNRNTIHEDAGLFSQGAGINYQEEFDNWKDFKLFQSFLDIFRRKKNKRIKIKRKKRQKKVPLD